MHTAGYSWLPVYGRKEVPSGHFQHCELGSVLPSRRVSLREQTGNYFEQSPTARKASPETRTCARQFLTTPEAELSSDRP